MDLSLTIGIWIIPVILTAVILLWPSDTGSDVYGVGSVISGVLKLIALLVVWLLYFMVT